MCVNVVREYAPLMNFVCCLSFTMKSLIVGQVKSMVVVCREPEPVPEPKQQGRTDVNLSSGSYTYSDEESEGGPKTVLKSAAEAQAADKAVKGKPGAARTRTPSRTRAKATSPTKSPERAPGTSERVSKHAARVELKEKTRSSAPVRHGDSARGRGASHRRHGSHHDKGKRSRSRSRRGRGSHRDKSKSRARRNKPRPECNRGRDDGMRRRGRSRNLSREPLQRRQASEVNSSAKQRKEKKYPHSVVCEYCGKELPNTQALWQHQESSNLCREYQGKGDARKPCPSCQKRVTNQEWSWEQHYLSSPSCRPKKTQNVQPEQIQNVQPKESQKIEKKEQSQAPSVPPVSELVASSSSSGADLSHLANFSYPLATWSRSRTDRTGFEAWARELWKKVAPE